MKDEFINKLELGLKNIIDNNIIFNLNLSCEDKYKKIIDGLKIDNDLSKDDVEEINEVISSIKTFIEFISIYCEELVNITNNMEEKVNEFVDIFDKKRITSLEEPIEEIIKEKLNLEDIDDIEEKVNLDYFDWLEKSKYYSDLFKNSIDKETKLLFEKINNDELFKKLIMNSEYGEEESILEENMIFLFRRNEYKLLDKVSFETALLAYNKGYYSLFKCFKDEYIDKLTKEQILTILPSINVGISALENKVKKIIKRVSFKEFNEHIISIAYSSMIYEMYDYIDDDSYVLEFCKYIRDKEVNNEYELFNYLLKFINNYFKKIKDVDRYEMFKMIKKSKRNYYSPVNEHKFSEFKGKGNAMCSEIAVVAGNILNVFGMDTHIVIGYVNEDGEEDSAHAYNLISYTETETGEEIDAIIDFSHHTEVCDINYKKIMDVPFIGEIEKLDEELVKKLVFENEILSFEDYFYMLLGNTVVKLGCQRDRNYHIGKEYEIDCKVIEKIKN